MTDIFVSYARSTAKEAQAIAEALRGLGYGVWLDDELPAHRNYADVIEERLRLAKAVVVIWSADAVKSQWVRAAADLARAAGTLVQLTLDGVVPPMPFNQIQCADLTGWRGDLQAPGWKKVLGSIADLARGVVLNPAPVRATPAHAEPLLAVLAFDNLSGDPEVAYFSDGVSEEVRETVAQGADLKVIGRASSFQFRGADKAAANVATKLGATHVLDGSVRRSGDRVRISTDLVDCATQTSLWSERFDRELTDIFAVQDEIATAVAAALKVVFASSRRAQPIDPAAFDLYLQARAVEAGPGELSAVTLAAVELLDRAVVLAPGFARAWARLSVLRSWRLRMYRTDEPYAVQRAKVVEAAETAIRLDPGLGNPYTAPADLEPFANYAEREALNRRALAVASNDPDSLWRAGMSFAQVGRWREALGHTRRAFELDPADFNTGHFYVICLEAVGRYQEARPIRDRLLVDWPQNDFLTFTTMYAAARRDDWDQFDEMVQRATGDRRQLPEIRYVATMGKALRNPSSSTTSDFLERVRQAFARNGTMDFGTLVTLCQLGQAEEAFALVEKMSFRFMFDPDLAWQASNTLSSLFASDAISLMLDPRFPHLCAKLGLCDYWVKSGQWPDCADEGVLPYDFKARCRKLATHA
jgi:adenylate cyclase